MKLPTKDTFLELKKLYNHPSAKLLPAHFAFYTVLSLAPIMIVVFFVAGLFSIPIESVVEPLRAILPSAVSDVITPVEESASGLSVGIWMVVALFVGSNGLSSVIVGSNSLYRFESNNYIRQRLKAFVLTLLFIILVLVGIAIIALTEYLLNVIPADIHIIITLVRWALITALAFAAIKYLYMVTPQQRIQSKFTNLGSLLTVSGWLIATLAYSFYYTNFSNYDAYYGSLTNIIVLMIWVLILSYVFVFGMLINVYQFHQAQKRGEVIDADTFPVTLKPPKFIASLKQRITPDSGETLEHPNSPEPPGPTEPPKK